MTEAFLPRLIGIWPCFLSGYVLCLAGSRWTATMSWTQSLPWKNMMPTTAPTAPSAPSAPTAQRKWVRATVLRRGPGQTKGLRNSLRVRKPLRKELAERQQLKEIWRVNTNLPEITEQRNCSKLALRRYRSPTMRTTRYLISVIQLILRFNFFENNNYFLKEQKFNFSFSTG